MAAPSSKESSSGSGIISVIEMLEASAEIRSLPGRVLQQDRHFGWPFAEDDAQRLGDLLRGVLVVLQLAREVLLVRGHVEVAVAGKVEDDRLLLAFLLAAERLVDRNSYRVRGLRRRNDAFAARELDRGLEGRDLRHRDGLDDLHVVQLADERRHAVIAQPARVNPRRHKAVAQRVHLHQRSHHRRVAEVVGVAAPGQGRAGGGLGGEEAGLVGARGPGGRSRGATRLTLQPPADERVAGLEAADQRLGSARDRLAVRRARARVRAHQPPRGSRRAAPARQTAGRRGLFGHAERPRPAQNPRDARRLRPASTTSVSESVATVSASVIARNRAPQGA